MNPTLRQMLVERAAEAERGRILTIAQHGLDVGQFPAAVALAQDPSMTLERATRLLAQKARGS